MKTKTNILDIFKGKDDKYSLRAVMAFLVGTVFSTCGVLDASVKGMEVSEGFYWACVTVILGLISVRALEQVAAIRTGQSTVDQNKNNFDQQVNNLQQDKNNSESQSV